MIKKWNVIFPSFTGDQQRRTYVYTPTMYEREQWRRFPVLYMFDGQNVFFDSDATFGKSWGMSHYLDYLDIPLIVAAVECNCGKNNERLAEYSPYSFQSSRFGSHTGKGVATIKWFIHNFKPIVDNGFRTLPGRENTFIAGSSMGGLMSLYALLEHNDTFSRAAALSPSLWVSPERLSELIANAPLSKDSVLYMDYGEYEMSNNAGMLKSFGDITARLIARGIRVTSRIIPEGTHSEVSWERQLPFMIPTLLYGMKL